MKMWFKAIRKYVFVAAFIFMLVFTCTGCSELIKREVDKVSNIQQAIKNAVNYIKEKYGIEATVTDAILGYMEGDVISTPTSNALVVMQHDNKTFNVYINGENVNTDGYDDYQKDAIADAAKQYVNGIIPGVESVAVYGGVAKTIVSNLSEHVDVLYRTYYDGTNVCQVLADNNYSIYATYVDMKMGNANNTDFKELLKDTDSDKYPSLYLVSVRDKEVLNNDLLTPYYEYLDNPKFAILVDNYCKMSGLKDRVYLEYKLSKIDDIYYYVEDGYEEYVEITKMSQNIDTAKWNGHGATDATVASDAYYVNSLVDMKDSLVYIFYPISDIKDYSKDDIDCAYCRYAAGKYTYISSTINNSVVGDYVCNRINPTDKSAGESYYFLFLNDK